MRVRVIPQIALALAFALFSHARAVAADEPKELVILIAPNSAAEQVRPFLNVIEDEISDLPVILHTEWIHDLSPDVREQSDLARRISEESGAVAVFWADFSRPHEIFLFFSQQDGPANTGRLLVRNLPAEESGIEARIEAVALIVRTSIKAFLEGGVIGVQAPTAPPKPAVPNSPPPPPAPRTEAPTPLLQASAAYILTGYASDENPVIHGGRFGLQLVATQRLRIEAAYRLQMPVQVRSPYVDVELRHHPIEVGASLRWTRRTALIELSFGAVVDPTQLSSRTRRPEATPLRVNAPVLFGLTPGVRAGWTPGERATLFVGAAVDVILNPTTLSARTETNERSALLRPWLLRPQLHVGAIFAIL